MSNSSGRERCQRHPQRCQLLTQNLNDLSAARARYIYCRQNVTLYSLLEPHTVPIQNYAVGVHIQPLNSNASLTWQDQSQQSFIGAFSYPGLTFLKKPWSSRSRKPVMAKPFVVVTHALCASRVLAASAKAGV